MRAKDQIDKQKGKNHMTIKYTGDFTYLCNVSVFMPSVLITCVCHLLMYDHPYLSPVSWSVTGSTLNASQNIGR